MRAQIKYYIDDLQGAINDLTTAISWKPKDYKLYEQRAFYKFQNKKYQSAIGDYTEALKINKNSKHAKFMLEAIQQLEEN